MELFIQIRNGEPYEHPIFGDNFREVFPDIDPDNLPPEFARFIRVEQPMPDGPYRKIAQSYQWDGGVVKDAWKNYDMTAEEKAEKIELVKSNKPEGDQWVFDEELCQWRDVAALDINTSIGVSRV
jgi:hypothetical protein